MDNPSEVLKTCPPPSPVDPSMISNVFLPLV
jgi:hypothetical protein